MRARPGNGRLTFGGVLGLALLVTLLLALNFSQPTPLGRIFLP